MRRGREVQTEREREREQIGRQGIRQSKLELVIGNNSESSRSKG